MLFYVFQVYFVFNIFRNCFHVRLRLSPNKSRQIHTLFSNRKRNEVMFFSFKHKFVIKFKTFDCHSIKVRWSSIRDNFILRWSWKLVVGNLYGLTWDARVRLFPDCPIFESDPTLESLRKPATLKMMKCLIFSWFSIEKLSLFDLIKYAARVRGTGSWLQATGCRHAVVFGSHSSAVCWFWCYNNSWSEGNN